MGKPALELSVTRVLRRKSLVLLPQYTDWKFKVDLAVVEVVVYARCGGTSHELVWKLLEKVDVLA